MIPKTNFFKLFFINVCLVNIFTLSLIYQIRDNPYLNFKKNHIMTTFRNFTPHTINMNNGSSFTSEGVARVSASFTEADGNNICCQVFGDIQGLPDPVAGVFIIVSGMVLSANSTRNDLVAPCTGHPDTIRNDRGHIVSVPCFTR